MNGDIRVKVSIHVVGTKEAVVAMDGVSDSLDALLIAARGVLDQAERVISQTPAKPPLPTRRPRGGADS